MGEYPLVSIPLSEYNDLKKFKDNFEKKFSDKSIVITHDSRFMGHSGYPVHTFSIINETDLIKELLKLLEVYRKDIREYHDEISELKYKQNKGFWK